MEKPLDPLENLDKSKGGIPATSEVKNKDMLITIDPAAGWTKETIDQILTSLAMLRLGFIRSITLVRK